jgi:hypothetical protein
MGFANSICLCDVDNFTEARYSSIFWQLKREVQGLAGVPSLTVLCIGSEQSCLNIVTWELHQWTLGCTMLSQPHSLDQHGLEPRTSRQPQVTLPVDQGQHPWLT